MGTIVFGLFCLFGGHDAPNDYQVLPLLISLDMIWVMLLLILLQMRKGKATGEPPSEA